MYYVAGRCCDRLPLISSEPHRPCYLRLRLGLSPFPSWNSPSPLETGGNVKRDSVASLFLFFSPPKFSRPFSVAALKCRRDLISAIHNRISRVSADLIDLEEVWLQSQTGGVTERPRSACVVEASPAPERRQKRWKHN